jgi:kinesin family member C1
LKASVGRRERLTNEQDSESAGMIPRAVEQVFRVAEQMRSKGWEYRMEGQFLEIVSDKIIYDSIDAEFSTVQ